MLRTLTKLRAHQKQGYSGARPDIAALVDTGARKILDVGCGAGTTAQLLHSINSGTHVVGVEPDEDLAAIARASLDQLICGQIDDPDTTVEVSLAGPYDTIICADVLEHVVDPLSVLTTLSRMLTDGGKIITSIPNVRHISTFIALGALGTWPTRDRGIHDRTHLRFFARKDILQLGRSAGLHRTRERRNLRLLEGHSWTMVPAKALDFWPVRAFFTFQYLHVWERRLVSSDK